MNTLSLFTSADAKQSIDISGLNKIVYDVIANAGADGIHSDEIRNQLPGLAYSSVTARYRKLLDTGRIFLNGKTRKGDSGRSQRVMVADVWSNPT